VPLTGQPALSHTDVLIIGGGAAALRAAIAACESEPALDVTLVTKGALGSSGVTATACSDRMAFHATLPHTSPGGADSWRYHADDIYTIGGQVSDADLAEVLARNAVEAFGYLESLGVPWAHRTDGSVDQFLTDGSIYPRACYTGPYTANHIETALIRRLRSTTVHVIEHQMAAELLLSCSGRIGGVALVSELDDRITVLGAGAVVLATGGAGQIFATNVFPPDCTGDGYAMSYRAGADLVNLEFIQIGLCSLATGLACSGSMMRALPRLVNENGQEFLASYMPHRSPEERHAVLFAKGASWPVSQRDPSHQVDIAVAREKAAGRRVYLDYAENPSQLDVDALPDHIRSWYGREKGLPLAGAEMATPLARLCAINRASVAWLAERGVDLVAGDRLEIAPAVQHFQGGVKIRTQAETAVPGLYAAGETAGGQHGANRPGGNALLDSQVFGKIAGISAAQYARAHSQRESIDGAAGERAVERLFSSGGLPAQEVITQVRQCMSAACGVCRTEQGLVSLVDHLAALAREGVRAEGEPVARALEAVNALDVAHAVAVAALRRDESRGPHLRFRTNASLLPLPPDDARWVKYIVIHRAGDGPVAELREPVRPGASGISRAIN
jgi:succinate dehydrogenase/fumarate reductase flavoprotein subunit